MLYFKIEYKLWKEYKKMKLIPFTDAKRRQILTAFTMTVLGLGVGIGSRFYLSDYDLPHKGISADRAVEVLADSKDNPIQETTTAYETQEETEAEVVYVPSMDSLNLAYYYPDGADTSNPQESYAGEVLKALAYKDSEWLSSIYELSSIRPEVMAKRLGRPASSVKGLYNPKDEKQNPQNPDSWVIHDWSKIDMSFYDESGHMIAANSNMKEIMSMASTYFYHVNPQEYQAFLDYTIELWDKSHSFQYSMSDVYYCDGCVEEAIAESSAAEASEAMETTAFPSEQTTTAGPALDIATSSQALIMPETTAPSGPGVTSPAAVEGTAVESGAEAAEHTGAEAVEYTAAEAGTEAGSGSGAPYSVLAQEGIPADETLPVAETPAGENEAGSADAAAKEQSQAPLTKCPGHVNLQIHAVISGLSSSKKSLYALDAQGSKEEEGWDGWSEDNRTAAVKLNEQDWEEAYGLTIYSTYISNPLSSAEIAYYMGLLPSDTSEARKKVVMYALSSVGKIPYYWGGKPSATDYVENHFGSLITPDEKGRSMKGLDCSGWINWVYWSSIGLRLPSYSTEGLAFCGTAIRREDLKPGDIIVRRGKDAHVVMFLCWEAGGRMKVVHESSSGHNNVSVGSMEARWPYYRKLID